MKIEPEITEIMELACKYQRAIINMLKENMNNRGENWKFQHKNNSNIYLSVNAILNISYSSKAFTYIFLNNFNFRLFNSPDYEIVLLPFYKRG